MPRSAALLISVFAPIQDFAAEKRTPGGTLSPPALASTFGRYSGAVISLPVTYHLPEAFSSVLGGDQYISNPSSLEQPSVAAFSRPSALCPPQGEQETIIVYVHI